MNETELVNDLVRCNRFFVYGTLRKGQGNFFNTKLSKAIHEQEMTVEMPYRMHSLGGFPALTRTGNDHQITGDLFTVDDIGIFQSLDRLEGYPRFYNRTILRHGGLEFWFYHIDEDWVKDHPVVKTGDWVQFINGEDDMKRTA